MNSHRLGLILWFCILCLPVAVPAWALDPNEVFGSDGKADLLGIRYNPETHSLQIEGNSSLHFQVDEQLTQTPPSVVVRLFNAMPRSGFRMLKTPIGPIRDLSYSVIPAKNGLPVETQVKVGLVDRFSTHSALSPDTKKAIVRFDAAPVATESTLPRTIVVRHLNYANARDVANFLSLMVPQGNGRVAGDEARNDLILDNASGQFDTFDTTLRDLDHPSQQVVLEAQVVEVNESAARNLGLTYSPTINTTLQEQAPTEQIGGGFSGTQPIPLQPIVRTGVNLQATLNMLANSGQAKILASPTVASLEGQESKIITGERIPYFVSQISGNQVFQVKEDFLAGVELHITPRVNEGRFVTTHIHTNVSTITGTTPQGYPQLSTRESEAYIRVAAGQTIVIGGLLQERDIENRSGIPFISDLPVLGALFSDHQKDYVKTELVVFITPHILSDE